MASRRRLSLPLLPLLSLALVLLLAASAAAGVVSGPAADQGEPSAYEMLEGFGFPRGILPEGVTGYTYRASDGAFEVFLGGDCEFDVDGGYRLTYRRRIYGNVEGGSIRNLGGVSVRMFLLNWGIDRVVMQDAGHLMFYVGPLSQAFPADNFEESPQCRGRRCGGGDDGIADGGVAGDVGRSGSYVVDRLLRLLPTTEGRSRRIKGSRDIDSIERVQI